MITGIKEIFIVNAQNLVGYSIDLGKFLVKYGIDTKLKVEKIKTTLEAENVIKMLYAEIGKLPPYVAIHPSTFFKRIVLVENTFVSYHKSMYPKGYKSLYQFLLTPLSISVINCPTCGEPTTCGCDSCIANANRGNPKNRTFNHSGDSQICPHCNATHHVDDWLNADMQQNEYSNLS